MSAEYKLEWRNGAGVKVAEVVNFRSLAYTKQVNGPGALAFELDGNDPKLDLLADDLQVRVRRRNKRVGLNTWYTDWAGFFLDEEWRTPEDQTIFKGVCYGPLVLLDDRVIAYPSDTANRTRFTNVRGETLIKQLVASNATAAGSVADGRKTNASFANLTIVIETDQGRGPLLDRACAWKQLLSESQDLTTVIEGDFDLVQLTPTQWEFRYFPGQRGRDLRSSLTFALERGNMRNPVYRRSRRAERTVAIVAGKEEGAARITTIRTGPNYSAANTRELFVDGRKENEDGLAAVGDQALDRAQARHELSFDVVQTQQCAYGRDYDIGDLVRASYQRTFDQQIRAITVEVAEDGNEHITVDMRTL